jgi:sporulation protein YlmC with PRC-barrel domain
MKTSALTAVALALGLAFSVNGAMAQDNPRMTNKARAYTLDSAHIDSKHLVGMTVNTPDGKRAGEIEHLIVNMKDGKVSHAIVGLGGLAGVGERHVVVPWSQLKLRAEGADRKDMVAVIDRATLDSAPRYTRTDRGAPAASPATAPAADRDRDGVSNRNDRAPRNPNKQ